MMVTEAELSARMDRVQVSRICDLVEELDACIVGTVTAKKALFSPGRGAACVAYHFRDTMGHDEHRTVPFAIEDDSGYALIEPRDAILQLSVYEGIGLHRSIVGARYLRNHGVPGSYRERCIEIGQRLYVLGSCTRELDARGDHKQLYRDRPGSHLRFGHRGEVALVLADRILSSD